MPVLIDLLWTLAGQAAGAAISAILSGGGGGANPWPAILSLSQMLDGQNSVNNQLIRSLSVINQTWNSHDQIAKRVDGELSQSSTDFSKALQHIVNVIIPLTARAVYSRVSKQQNRGQSDLWKRVRNIDGWIKSIWKWESATNKLLAHQVLPVVARYHSFQAWWYAHFAKPANALIDWHQNPGHLSKFLASTMTQDVVQTLGDGKHRGAVDNLWAHLLRYAPDMVYRLDQAAVGVLNSGQYPGG